MRKETAKKWVAALRSGEYLQARGSLHKKGRGYCCLGVLCDLAPERTGTWQNGDLENDEGERFGLPGELGVTATLLTSVSKWAGLSKATYETGSPQTSKGSLIELNDKQKLSFAQIADVIEAEWATL